MFESEYVIFQRTASLQNAMGNQHHVEWELVKYVRAKSLEQALNLAHIHGQFKQVSQQATLIQRLKVVHLGETRYYAWK